MNSEKNDVSIEPLLALLKLYFNFLFFTGLFFLGFLGVLKESEKNLIGRGGEEMERDDEENWPTFVNSLNKSSSGLISFRIFRTCRLSFIIICENETQ